MDTDSVEAWASLSRKDTLALVGLGGAGAEAAHDIVQLGIPVSAPSRSTPTRGTS